MFIRRTRTRSIGEYFTFRLVRSERIGSKVRQRTLLNLGRHFDVAQSDWPALCRRIDELLAGQLPLPPDGPPALESHAQRITALLLAGERIGAASSPASQRHDFQHVDVDSLELIRPRSVGVEHVGLWAMDQLGLRTRLEALGIGASLRTAAIGSIIARMARPGSERATRRWLGERSALGELLGVDFETMGPMRLSRASDALMAHREAIEHPLFDRAMDLFDLHPTVTLYDLTNTYFEGEASGQPNARRGHSKDKRTDCPLLTLGLVLDASGFVRRSKSSPATCANITPSPRCLTPSTPRAAPWWSWTAASPPKTACAGCASTNTAPWWSAVNAPATSTPTRRCPSRPPPITACICTRSSATTARRLGCIASPKRAPPRSAPSSSASPNASRPPSPGSPTGCPNPAPTNAPTNSGSASGGSKRQAAASPNTTTSHSTPTRPASAPPPCASPAARFTRRPLPGSMLTHPGVYCLRTNQTDWDESTLWRTYFTLTDIEAVFRSLKSELGLRPIYHHKPIRAEGHLFISVIAYQLVQVIRRRLRQTGQCARWTTLRRILEGQQRITATFRRADGRTLHVRKATRAEPSQQAIYEALGIDHAPGGIRKTLV